MVRIALVLIDLLLINCAFLVAFVVRYWADIPGQSFQPYKSNFVFLTIIYILSLSFFAVYRKRFRSSYDLFQRVFLGLCLGTLSSVTFVYVFRVKWSTFPSSVFVLAFLVALILICGTNGLILRLLGRIRKRVVILGEGEIEEFATKRVEVERKGIDKIKELAKCRDIDEVIICERIRNDRDINLLIYLLQKRKINAVFSPSIYMELLPDRINGDSPLHSLGTFFGRKSDTEEFLIRVLDVLGSVTLLILSLPLLVLISIAIRLDSRGPVFYKQQRAGKDGEVFTLYKFRTMVADAEKLSGLSPAEEGDPRITGVGTLLRKTRLDELPQLLNILRGEMSLVGPRPENLYRVQIHKALQGIRLAVKPGLTGLAQIQSLYDLKPQHKIKYDYLYIQRRSLLLNLYLIARTVPVVLSKKGQ